MKKFQDGGDSLRLPTESEWGESVEDNIIDEETAIYKPSLYDKMSAQESVVDETGPGVSGEEFMSKMGYITEGLVESKPSVDVVAPSPGFGSSQYDKYAVTEEDLYNLDEVRGANQSTWDVLGNGVVNLIGGAILQTSGNTVGSIYGFGSSMMTGFRSMFSDEPLKDPLTGRELGTGDAMLKEFTNNSVFQWLDENQEDLRESFPIYYTQAEREKSLMSQAFTTKFWADTMVNGAVFLIGAAASEFLFTAGGAFLGGLSTVETGPGAVLGAAGGAALGGAAGLSRIAKLRKLFGIGSTMKRGVQGAALLDEAALAGGMAATAWGKTKAGAKIVRQLVTGAGFEASLESRMAYEEMLDTMLEDHYGDRIHAAEQQKGSPLSREEKIKLLSPEEASNLDKIATNVTNGVFAGNMALVGISNVLMLGNLYMSPLKGRLSIPKLKGFDKGVAKAVGAIGGGETAIRYTNAALRWQLKAVYEGAGEEGGQSVMSKAAHDYAVTTMMNDAGMVETIGTFAGAIANGIKDTYYTKEGHTEILAGYLLAAIGLPGAKFGGGMGMTTHLKGYDARMQRIANFDKYSNEVMELIGNIRKKNPAILHDTISGLMATTLINSRKEAYEAAVASGNMKLAKDIEVANIIDMVMHFHDTKRLDQLQDYENVISGLKSEDFKTIFSHPEEMTEEEVLERKSQVISRTKETVKSIVEAAKAVDKAVGFSFDEKTNYTEKGKSLGYLRRNLIAAAASIELNDRRENDMIGEIADLSGGTVTSVDNLIDSITFQMPDGSMKTLSMGQMNIGETVSQQILETVRRIQQLGTSRAEGMTAKEQSALLGDLQDYLEFLQEYPEDVRMGDILFEMAPAAGSELSEQIATFMNEAPDAALKFDRLTELITDIRKVRASRLMFKTNLEMLMNPNTRELFFSNAKSKAKKIEEEKKAQEKKEKPTKTAEEKSNDQKKIEDFKEKLRSLKKSLKAELETFDSDIKAITKEIQEVTEQITALVGMEKRAEKNKSKLASSSVVDDNAKLNVEQIREKLEKAKEFLAEARKKEEKFQSEVPERKREINMLLDALKEVEEKNFDASKYDPTLKDVHTAVIEYAKIKGVDLLEGASMAKAEFIQEAEDLDKSISSVSKKLDDLKGLLQALENFLDEAGKIPADILTRVKDSDYIQAMLERYPELDLNDLNETIKALTENLNTLIENKKIAEEQQKIARQVIKSEIFKYVLAHVVEEKEKGANEYDMFVGPTYGKPKMYKESKPKEEDLFKKDIADGMNYTVGLQGSWISGKKTITGAVKTFTDHAQKLMRGEKLSALERKEFQIAQSQLVFFNAINNASSSEVESTSNILHSFKGKDGLPYGKVLVFVHSGMFTDENIINVPADLRGLKELFKDEGDSKDLKDIKAVLATHDPKTKKLTFDRYQKNLIFTSIPTPSLENRGGGQRYLNDKKELTKDEITTIQNQHRDFRNNILKSYTLNMVGIKNKFQGSVLAMSEKEKAENGGRLNFAIDALRGVRKDAGNILLIPSVVVKNTEDEYQLGIVSPKNYMKGNSRNTVPSITLQPGQVAGYDDVRHVLVPLVPAALSEMHVDNIFNMVKFALTKHEYLVKEKEASVVDASTAVFATSLNIENVTKTFSKFLMDLVHVTDRSEEGYNFILKLQNDRFGLLYGKGDVFYLEDLQDPSKVKELKDFLKEKYHNVNQTTLRTKENSKNPSVIQKVEKGFSKNTFEANAGQEWAYFEFAEEPMDAEGNPVLATTESRTYVNYNEYLLSVRDEKGVQYSPLMSTRRKQGSSRLSTTGSLSAQVESANNMRTEGGGLSFFTDLHAVPSITTKKKERGNWKKGKKKADEEAAEETEPTTDFEEILEKIESKDVEENVEEDVDESLEPSEKQKEAAELRAEQESLEKGKKAPTPTFLKSPVPSAPTATTEVPGYNYNLSNVSEEEREKSKDFVIDTFGNPVSINFVERDGDTLYQFTFENDLYVETPAKGTMLSFPKGINEKIVELSKTDPSYDIKFLIGLNKLAEKTDDVEEDEDEVFMSQQAASASKFSEQISDKERAKQIEQALKMRPLEVALTESLIQGLDGPAVGQLTGYAKVLLSTLGPSGVIFHETFHDVSLYVLSPKDASILYNKVRQIPGETITYKGEEKKMSELSDKEADEWLAEEFRAYVLSGGNYQIGKGSVKDTRSILKKFFDAVSALVRRVLKLNQAFEYDPIITSIEGFFKDIEEGKFLTSKRNMLRGKQAPANLVAKLPGFNQVTTNDMLSSLSAHLGDLFNKEFTFGKDEKGDPITFGPVSYYDLYSPEARRTNLENFQKMYLKATANLQREIKAGLSDSRISAEKRAALAEVDAFLSNPLGRQQLRQMHLNAMSELGFSISEDQEQDEMEITSRNWVDEMDALKISATKSAPPIMKLMLSTVRDENAENSIGIKGAYNTGTLLKQIQRVLANTTTYREQMAKLAELSGFEELEEEAYLYGARSMAKKGFEWAPQVYDLFNIQNIENKTYEEVAPRIAFSTHMAQAQLDVEYMKVSPTGEIFTIDPALESVYANVRRTWAGNLKSNAKKYPFIKLKDNKIVFDLDEKFTYEFVGVGRKTLSLRELPEFLRKLRTEDDLTSELLNLIGYFGVEFSDIDAAKELISSENMFISTQDGQRSYTETDLYKDVEFIVGDLIARGSDSYANLFDREYATAVTRMNNLVKLEEQTGKRDVELMYLNSENNMESSIIRYHYISQLVSLKYADVAEFFDVKRYPYGTNSKAVQAFREGKKFSIVNMSGLQADVPGQVGNKVTGLSKRDIAVVQLNSILKNTFTNLRAADQSTEFGIKFPFEIEDTFDKAADIALDYLYDEFVASVKNMDDLQYVAKFASKINEDGTVEEGRIASLRLMKAMLSAKQNAEIESKIADPTFRESVQQQLKLSENGKSLMIEEYIKANREELKKSILERFEVDRVHLKDRLEKMGLISLDNGLGTRTFYAIDGKFLSETGEDVSQTVSNKRADRIMEMILAKHFIAKHEMFKMFYNDPAYYTDMFKRFKGTVGTKILMDTDPEILEWLNNDNRLYRTDGKLDAIHLKEPMYALQAELLEAYAEMFGEDSDLYKEYTKNIKYSDGMMIIDLPTTRMIAATTNQWSPQQERSYTTLTRAERKDKEYFTEDGGAITQLKTQYYGPVNVYKEDNTKVPSMAFLKMSKLPLYEQMAYVNGKKYPNILRMLDFMRENQVGALIIPSAIKVGGPNEFAQVEFQAPKQERDRNTGRMRTAYDMQFPEELPLQASKMEFDLRFMGVQLEISPYFKGKTTSTVQIQAQALSDLFDEGVLAIPTEHKETIKDYNDALNALTRKAYADMLQEFQIERSEQKGVPTYSMTPETYQKVLEILQKEGSSVQAGAGLLGGIQYLTEKGGDFKLEYFVDRYRMETMLMSAIGKKIIRKKIFGDQAVQMPMIGYEVEEIGQDDEGNAVTTDASLKFYNKNGKWAAQVRLPHWFKELYEDQSEIILNEDGSATVNGLEVDIDPEVLEIIGIRIPTDGIHSAEIFEVVGFFPKHMGSKISVPPGIVVKAGSDFDIDKLTLYFMNYIRGEKNIRTVPFYNDLESWFNAEKQAIANAIEKLQELKIMLPNLEEIRKDTRGFEDMVSRLTSLMEYNMIKEGISPEEELRLFTDLFVPEHLPFDQKAELLKEYFEEQFTNVLEDDEALRRELLADKASTVLNNVTLPRSLRRVADQKGFDALIETVREKIAIMEDVYERRNIAEETFEDWRANNPTATEYTVQSKKALENQYIRLLKQLLSIRERRDTFLKPVGTPNIDSLVEELEEMYDMPGRGHNTPVNLKEVTDYHEATLITNLIDVTHAYLQGKKDVGIFALASTHTVKAQMVNMRFDMNTTYKIPGKNKNDESVYAAIHLDLPQFKKERNDMGLFLGDSTVSMGGILNAENMHVTEMMSEGVNAAVDTVNNAVLHWMNLNPDLAPAGIALLRMGVPLRMVRNITNQPIVKEFMERKDASNGHLSNALNELYEGFKKYDSDIIEDLRSEYSTAYREDSKYKEPVNSPTYFTNEMLEGMIGLAPENMTPKQQEMQLQLLRDIQVYMAIGNDQTSVINAQSFDTRLPKSRAHMRLIMAQYNEVLNRGVFPNVERITESDELYLSALREYNAIGDSLFQDMFVAEDGTYPFRAVFNAVLENDLGEITNGFQVAYSKLLISLAHPNNRLSLDKKLRVLERFEQFHISGVVQNIAGPLGVLSQQSRRLMFGEGGKSMAQQVLEIQTTDHPLKNNPFIQSFIPVVQEERGTKTKNDYLEPRFKTLNIYDDAAIVDAYEEIRKYDSLNNTSYATDLWKTAIMQAGTMNTPFSFLDRMSGDMTAEMMKETFDIYKGSTIEVNDPNNANIATGDLLLNLFAQNMIYDNDIVPYVKNMKYISDRIKSHALFVKTYKKIPGMNVKAGQKTVGLAKMKRDFDLYKLVRSDNNGPFAELVTIEKPVEMDGVSLSSRSHLQAYVLPENTLHTEEESKRNPCK